MEFFAHSAADVAPNSQQWHSLAVHLRDTGKKASVFLEGVRGGEFGRAAGLLHDLGKYTADFQERLAGASKQVDHATAGARVAIEKYGSRIGKILAFCIAGHHAGLANGSGSQQSGLTLEQRLGHEYRIPKVDSIWETEIDLPPANEFSTLQIKPAKGGEGFSVSFFIRMLFSSLVDADRQDTRAWFAGEKTDKDLPKLSPYPTLLEIKRRLDAFLADLTARATPSSINTLRHAVLTHARGQADRCPGLFTLTVPTGGGKTLTSLAFALDHAVRHGLKRIVYVIPYISIVEQTAGVFREALGDESHEIVLEHHSNFDEERVTGREGYESLRLAMQTWDQPIVVTTAVQFYESLFSNHPSRCRKLHNVADSVVILDEAQTLPLGVLRPCVSAISELARNWGASVVLCTATQPALGASVLKPSYGFAGGLQGVLELAPDPKGLYESIAAKRTRIVRVEKPVDDASLASQLLACPQALCIVNTRRHARELYERLTAGGAEAVFHLTTSMCAYHRRQKLAQIRQRLLAGDPVRLVATSLIEAGVDIDFPVVWRAEAGLESLIQAAGRCNREGKRKMCDVYAFQPAEGDGRRPPPEIAQFAAAARAVMRQHRDPLSLEAIED